VYFRGHILNGSHSAFAASQQVTKIVKPVGLGRQYFELRTRFLVELRGGVDVAASLPAVARGSLNLRFIFSKVFYRLCGSAR
jgi:hypothetical protein